MAKTEQNSHFHTNSLVQFYLRNSSSKILLTIKQPEKVVEQKSCFIENTFSTCNQIISCTRTSCLVILMIISFDLVKCFSLLLFLLKKEEISFFLHLLQPLISNQLKYQAKKLANYLKVSLVTFDDSHKLYTEAYILACFLY